MSRPMPLPAIGHMPFAGHRTCAQVRLDEERASFQCWACVSRSACPFKRECPHYAERSVA